MNKKVVIIASAVLAFFAGAIWVDCAPVVAPLVAFLEVCAGFCCGFFFHKVLTDEAITKLTAKIKSINEATKKVKEENTVTKASKPKAKKSSKSE